MAVKLYPAMLVPVALAYVWRRRGRHEAIVCLGAVRRGRGAAFLPFLVRVAPNSVARGLGRQLSRPLRVREPRLGRLPRRPSSRRPRCRDALAATAGGPGGDGNRCYRVLLSLAQIAVLAWIWLRRPATAGSSCAGARRRSSPSSRWGRCSRPFLIWLVPVVPLVGGCAGVRASALLAAALVLTQLWFPSRYWDLARELDPLPSTLLVLLRDLVLVALLVTLIRRSRSGSEAVLGILRRRLRDRREPARSP